MNRIGSNLNSMRRIKWLKMIIKNIKNGGQDGGHDGGNQFG